MSKSILIATIMRPQGETGVQTHFDTYVKYLVEQSRPVRLVTPYDIPKWQVYPIFAVRRLIDVIFGTASVWWYRYWHRLFLTKALRRALIDTSVGVVYAQCPLSADAALCARRSPEQKVFMVVHFNISQADEWVGKGLIPDNGHLFNRIRLFESVTIPRLDGLVFVSEFMRHELVKRIPEVKDIPYKVVRNFVRDPGFPSQLGRPMGDLICVGTLENRKNQRYAVEIVAASKRMGRPMSLTLVGAGPDSKAISELVKNLDVAGLVKMTGHVNGASNLMKKHRAYLHVASMENLPIAIIEAMANGLPVFATPVGGVPELFRDNEEGRFIPLDNAEAAAVKVIEWLASDAIMEKARIAARERYASSFKADYMGARLTNFLISFS